MPRPTPVAARQDVSVPAGTSAGIGLQASWEIDVFGRNRAARDAAEARLEGAGATWHDARVVVAAETANLYLALRACEALLAQARLDAESRAETARLTELSMQSGFESRANAALTRASAAQGRVLVKQQSEQCDQTVKALVALTGHRRAGSARAARRGNGAPAAAGGDRGAVGARRRAGAAARRLRRAPATSSPPAPTSARPRPTAGRASRSPAASARPRFDVERRLVQRHDLEHRPGGRQPAGVRCRRAPRQRRRRARALRRGRRAPTRRRCAMRCARSRTRSSLCKAPPTATPTRRPPPTNFEALLRATEARYRSGLGDPVRARGRAPQRPGGADRADRPAPRARRRLDRPLPRPRRRLVGACRRPDRRHLAGPPRTAMTRRSRQLLLAAVAGVAIAATAALVFGLRASAADDKKAASRPSPR